MNKKNTYKIALVSISTMIASASASFAGSDCCEKADSDYKVETSNVLGNPAIENRESAADTDITKEVVYTPKHDHKTMKKTTAESNVDETAAEANRETGAM